MVTSLNLPFNAIFSFGEKKDLVYVDTIVMFLPKQAGHEFGSNPAHVHIVLQNILN
jgi:hypothetical protein